MPDRSSWRFCFVSDSQPVYDVTPQQAAHPPIDQPGSIRLYPSSISATPKALCLPRYNPRLAPKLPPTSHELLSPRSSRHPRVAGLVAGIVATLQTEVRSIWLRSGTSAFFQDDADSVYCVYGEPTTRNPMSNHIPAHLIGLLPAYAAVIPLCLFAFPLPFSPAFVAIIIVVVVVATVTVDRCGRLDLPVFLYILLTSTFIAALPKPTLLATTISC